MGRKGYQAPTHLSHEFELDLAPLLAVMVKLVPVLLVSSAFVQMMMIESDLPQAVKAAVQRNEQKPTANVQLDINNRNGMRLLVDQPGHAQVIAYIPNRKDGSFDFPTLQQKLVQIKSTYPEVYRLELNPGADIAYRDIVKIMDEARKARDRNVHFPVLDTKTNQQSETDYMFPNVVFVNMMEG